jgi:hypothetical protein
MHQLTLLSSGITHQLYAGARRLVPATCNGEGDRPDRDRGAVSLEQVLWFVAAGISVAVIAGILWNQIKDKADDPITPPAAP